MESKQLEIIKNNIENSDSVFVVGTDKDSIFCNCGGDMNQISKALSSALKDKDIRVIIFQALLLFMSKFYNEPKNLTIVDKDIEKTL